MSAVLGACRAAVPIAATATPTLALTLTETPTVTSQPSMTPPPPTPTLPPQWTEAAPGLEVRTMSMALAEGKSAEVVLTRIDVTRYDVRVHYDPAAPAQVSAWRERLGALAAINAGFFHEDNTTAGLIVSEGQAEGVSFDTIEARYYEFSGMLAISQGVPSLRYLAASPYQSGEPLDYVVQGLPMLIAPETGPVAFDLPDRTSRRTAVALDASGRLLLITVANYAITLYDLRDWLANTPELAITAALGLDGGPSTGYALEAGAMHFTQDSWTGVPSVLAIYPR